MWTRRPLSLLIALAGALLLCPGAAAPPIPKPVVREYWVAAVPQPAWNVVPTGRDVMSGIAFEPGQTTTAATVYRRYSRGWRTPLPTRYGGIPGPTIHARVGEVIVIHFRNLDPSASHSMHFHGVHYAFRSDGSYIPGLSGRGADVRPGQSFTYRLIARQDSVGVWPYHDHSPSMMTSIRAGLYGALSIRGRRERAPDREFVVFLGRMNGFDTINGRAFIGNTPTFRARTGDLVQWDVLAIGNETHTFHVHGHRWLEHRTAVDVKTVGPAESFRIRWREDEAGNWLYHCHVELHMEHGMIGLYEVRAR